MDYGIKVYAGNFCMRKVRKALSKKEIDAVYSHLPEKSALRVSRKGLQRAGLPCIEVMTVSGSWKVTFAVGETMFAALDGLTVVKNGARHEVGGPEKGNAEMLFCMMYADCSVVGDDEYQKAKAEAFGAYVKRASAKRMEAERDMDADALVKESDAAVDDVMERDRLTEAVRTISEGGHAE